MSEETLRRFLERVNQDAAFRASMQADPESAFAGFGLSPVEQAALSFGDEDALRRLAGAEVAGFFFGAATLGCAASYAYCPRDTPGSGNHCGPNSGRSVVAVC